MPFASALTAAARRDLNVIETGPNTGPRVNVMLSNVGAPPGSEWCAAAVSTWLFDAARAQGVARPVAGSAQAKAVLRQFQDGANSHVRFLDVATLRTRGGLAPGMVVFWTRGPSQGPYGHIGVVSKVGAGGAFWSVEGNAGPNADRVVESPHNVASDSFLGAGAVMGLDGSGKAVGALALLSVIGGGALLFYQWRR